MSPSHLVVTCDSAWAASRTEAGSSRCRGAFMVGVPGCGSPTLYAAIAAWTRVPVHREQRMSTAAGSIRVGVGGWTFEPWRQTFYPPGLPHSRELQHMGSVLTAVEVNGTFYS